MADAVRSIGVTQVTYYRGRREYGGLQMDQVKRMKELKLENQRLRRLIGDETPASLWLIYREVTAELTFFPAAAAHFAFSASEVLTGFPSVG